MKEYTVLISCLVATVIAGKHAWFSSAESMLQIRDVSKYLSPSPEPARYSQLGRQSLITRALPSQNRQRVSSADARIGMPSSGAPKQNRRAGIGEAVQKTRLTSGPKWQQHSSKTTQLRATDPEHHNGKSSVTPSDSDYAKPTQRYKSKASILGQGPAAISVSRFASHDDLQKLIGHEHMQHVPTDTDMQVRTKHGFGTMATGYARDLSPSSGRRPNGEEVLKAKAQGSRIFTTVMAPTGGRGNIVFKDAKKTEVVPVPGGKTVELHRYTDKGPLQATASVTRGGHVRIGSLYEGAPGIDHGKDNGMTNGAVNGVPNKVANEVPNGDPNGAANEVATETHREQR